MKRVNKHRLYSILLFCLLPSLFGQSQDTDIDFTPEAVPEIQPEKIMPVVPDSIAQPREVEIIHPEEGTPPLPEEVVKTQTVKPAEPSILQPAPPALRLVVPGTSLVLSEQIKEKELAVQAELGAGYSNHLFASIYLAKLGPRPQFTLDFSHTVMDGSFFTPEPQFHYTRTDTIAGDLNLSVKPLSINMNGSFHELELGLQNNSIYDSRITRKLKTDILLSFPFSDHFKLTLTPQFDYITIMNRGSTTEQFSELLPSGLLTGELLFEKLKTGLRIGYDYRSFSAGNYQQSPNDLHRIKSSLFGRWIVSERFRTEIEAGWTFLSPGTHLFPFTVSFTVTPFPFLTTSVEGGYAHRPVTFIELVSQCSLAELPEELNDNRGWFTGFDITVLLWKGAQLSGSFSAVWNSHLPYCSQLNDLNGFFSTSLYSGITLEPSARFEWTIEPLFTFHTGWKGVYFLQQDLIPVNIISLEGDIHTPTKKLGSVVTIGFSTGLEKTMQLPLLGVSGYYRFSKNIMINIEASDILSVFMSDEPRYMWKPYKDIGFQFTATMKITF